MVPENFAQNGMQNMSGGVIEGRGLTFGRINRQVDDSPLPDGAVDRIVLGVDEPAPAVPGVPGDVIARGGAPGQGVS